MPPIPMFRPASFIVFLRDGVGSYVSDEIIPQGAPLGPSSGIEIDVTAIGLRITDANEFAKLGAAENRNKDFALGGDIDLTGTGAVWNGVSGYTGHFYGNGYTIKGLVLNKTSGDTGLFTTLANGAVLENFTLEVSTRANPDGSFPARTGSSHFGGVVGYTSNGATLTLKDIRVKGRLDYGPMNTNAYILAGALIGETAPNSNTTVENCVSELDITLKEGIGAGGTTLGFGGIVGKAYGRLTIKNSYSTGNILVSHNADKNLCAGGIIGVSNNCTLTIENCYSSSEVIATNNSTNGRKIFAGGMVGWVENGPQLVVVKNSAAIGTKTLAATTKTFFESNRIVAMPQTTVFTGSGFGNNFALKNMLTGNDSNAAAQDFNGGANTAAGLGKTIDELKALDTWTNIAPNGLGWNTTVWNFSGLSQGKWPVLK
jgi:hypothetical protein